MGFLWFLPLQLAVPAASASGPEPSRTVPHLLLVVPFDPRRQQSRRPG